MSAHDPGAWSDFGVAVVGAAAALTGLIFVSVSINLARLLAVPALAARAGGSVVMVHGAVAAAVAAPMVVAGASLVAGRGGGLYWLVASVVLAVAAGTANAWVLLVEVVRDPRYEPTAHEVARGAEWQQARGAARDGGGSAMR